MARRAERDRIRPRRAARTADARGAARVLGGRPLARADPRPRQEQVALAAHRGRRLGRRRGGGGDRVARDPVARSGHPASACVDRLTRRALVGLGRAREPSGHAQHGDPLPEMSIRSPRALALAATVAALAALAPFVLGPEPAALAQTGPGAQLLDDARRAAQEQDFSGVLEVSWSDAKGAHSSDVSVRSANGVLALGDRPQVIVNGARRFVQSPDGWLAVWNQDVEPGVPSPTAKWELAVHDGPTVAGRPTREIDATDRHDGLVRERLYLDETTSLLLRREQLDARGRTVQA